MKRTIIILILIAAAVGLGYLYQVISTELEKRAHPLEYTDIVEFYSGEYNIPKEIIYSVINTESSFRSDVKSPKGAVGLMQITPDTFDWLMTKTGEALEHGLLYDPMTNIKYGTYFLRYLFDEFGKWDLVFAAYNAGRTRVNEWRQNPEYIDGNNIIFIPYEETRNYIVKVNANMAAYRRLYFKN